MSDITEREAFIALIHATRSGRDSARSLALLRGDVSWLRVAALFDQIHDKTVKMIDRSQHVN